MTFSRRDWCLWAAALAAPQGVAAQNQVLHSKVFEYQGLPVRTDGEVEYRDVLAGRLQTGGSLEIHVTWVPPGAQAHPPHHHRHEEIFLIREGTVEVTLNGKVTRLGAGSVGFAASNDEHGVRNVGATPAEYFVVALGQQS